MTMTTWEIEVFNATDEDMIILANALYHAGIGGQDADDIGMYFEDGSSNSLFVYANDLQKAVEVINNLGFETDEDSLGTNDA